MGIADRDYMRERVRDRGGVFRPGTRHANPYRTRQIIVGILTGAAFIAGCLYLAKNGRGGPRPMASAPTTSNPSNQPALQQSSLVAPSIQPAVIAQEQPFPASGTTQWFRQIDARQNLGVLRIMDTSDIPGNKVVRIRDAFQAPIAQIYIQGGEGAVVQLPLGRYDMTIASGSAWYGPERQFGPAAIYFRTNGADIISGEVNYRILPSNQGGQPMAPIQSDAF